MYLRIFKSAYEYYTYCGSMQLAINKLVNIAWIQCVENSDKAIYNEHFSLLPPLR